MTRAELRKFIDKWFCGCGQPEEASRALLRILRLYPMFEEAHRTEFDEWVPDEGLRNLLLHMVTTMDLAEHGGSASAGWLTGYGERIRDALIAEEADEFEALHDGMWCIHGIDLGQNCEECHG